MTSGAIARIPLATRRWVIIFAAALLLALAAAGWQGWLLWQRSNPAVDESIRVGETITIDGSTYRVDSFTVADQFPNTEKGEPPVRAPKGTKIVLIVLTTEITNDSVDPSTHVCEATLVDNADRAWATESTITYALRRPKAFGCSGTSENEIRPHRPLQVGFSYVIPDDATDEVAMHLRLWSSGDFLLRVQR